MSHLTPFLQHARPDLSKLSRGYWFDNSTIEAHQSCPRLAWYQYKMGLETKSPAQAAGTVWHAALDAFHTTGDFQQANVVLAKEYQTLQNTLQQGPNRLSFGNINNALIEYTNRFGNDKSIVYHEQEFSFAIWISGLHIGSPMDCAPGNCEKWSATHGPAPESCFWLVGRFDGIITYMNNLLLLENKTCSNLGLGTLTGYSMSRQPTTYVYAVKEILKANGYAGPPLKGVLFNICKFGATNEFARHQVLRHDAQLQEWIGETREIVAQIREAWNEWTPKPLTNRRHCNTYGLCKFTDLCNAWAGSAKNNPPGVLSIYPISQWRPF